MKRILPILASVVSVVSTYAADIRIADNISTNTIWTNDNTYILDAQVYVIDGASLTIEPGTVIKGAALSTGASALIVTRGSKIYALGTPSEPIVFTSEADPLDGSLTEAITNQWGGVIILGAAPLNSESRGEEGDFDADPQVPYTDNIEGLENSIDNDYTEFGGLDPNDNSGIFRYVSIRHGGSLLSNSNEINGLTMGGVGDGTIIEFVEVFANKDDGFEWFGGTVNARFLVSAFSNDDSFDYDQGWTGKGQFWFSIGTTGVSGDEQDHGGEHDGSADITQDGLYRGMGTVYNATYIGPGAGAGDEGVFEISDDAGARYYNSIFMSWQGHGIDVLNTAIDGLTELEDGVTRIDFTNNIWFDLGATGDVLAGGNNAAAVSTFLTAAGKNNNVQDPMIRGVSRAADGGLDPRPGAGSPAFSNARKALPAGDPWYIPVSFQGAFGSTNWMYGWTYLDQAGYLPEIDSALPRTMPTSVSSVTHVLDGEGEYSNVNVVVEGELPRFFIIRARGPKLMDDGRTVDEVMPDPQIEITDFFTKEIVAIETGWVDRADPIDTLGAMVGMATLAATEARPTNDTTSAQIMISLNPGVYVIKVTDEGGVGGDVQAAAWMIDR